MKLSLAPVALALAFCALQALPAAAASGRLLKSNETRIEAANAERPYATLIARHAAENGVPLELAHAVVSVESRYRPNMTGSAGEIGLMQIKLATARGLGYTGSRKALYDPDINLRWGMLYLGMARDLADGDLCGTILRYNAGHAAKRMSKGPARYCSKVRQILASN
ncbi:lytic transglycosylase domain-containing protein [Prosthecomicrobium pneumaticum]|uniref:Soluble lytic murein transglycosylase-like protein n=1 Tax=Prosthecomicrobium pneumaticum TaxID=81895 RepID=A0A7W9L1V3_9HYPH|nr:transglycosylase SLT domain-containing protein [Prosthecomicrobium pneumaticum]MBB5753007.1 soluble lytic murein transglycosylase-like protein [Prosthecomicrobium pneumaticum]